jgi:hypothetical protein
MFDCGDEPRGPVEESLGGDFRKAVAVAEILRDELTRELDATITGPDVADYGAVLWIEDAPPPRFRSLTVEPVPGVPLRWALLFTEMKGCLGFAIPSRFDRKRFDDIAGALDRIAAREGSPLRAARWVDKHER